MGVIAEFAVQLPLLRYASRSVPDMEIQGEDIILEPGGPLKFVFVAYGQDLEKFESALDEDPTVDEFVRLSRLEDRAFYIVVYTDADESKGTYIVATENDIVYLESRVNNGEFHNRAYAPDRAAFKAIFDHCRTNGIPFRVEKLYTEETGLEQEHGLTETQREALVAAYENGYFESPRQITLESLADELDVSRQAVSNRLRKGHQRLIESMLR